MKLRTPVSINPNPNPIDYSANILLLGSCFADNIAAKLDYFQFRNLANPYGILFHPLAIDEAIHRCLNQQQYTVDDIFEHNGRWQSFGIHSDLSHPDREMMLQTLNNLQSALRESLSNATHVIITYGTAWVYREKSSKNIVANCHKVSAKQFDKELLSADTIEAAITNTLSQIGTVNPAANIILTISPVRHIKDGMIQNQRSKANLISALHNIIELSTNAKYFPAYEILIDELRDYRFYADDMIHPSNLAIEFIWQKFTAAHIALSAYPTMDEVGKVQKALLHRPFDVLSASHQKFLGSVNSQVAKLQAEYPHMNF